MALPNPKSGEKKEQFISRCMGDDMSVKEFPEIKQRYAVCIGSWLDKYENSIGKFWYKKKQQQTFEMVNTIRLSMAEIGERGGINPSKKAPKSDTPNPNPRRGSDVNKPGAASTGRGVIVPERIMESLQKKSDDFNEKYKDKLGYGTNVGMLKTVYQRGVGAFQTSHSPRVQSPEQWAQARVNAFLYLLKEGRPQNPKYVGDFDLLPEKHPKNKKQ